MNWKPRSNLFWHRLAALGFLLLISLPAYAQFPPEVDIHGSSMRSSLMFVIYLCFLLFWGVVLLAIYVFALKTYYRMRRAYREQRKKHFQQGIELVLMEEPFDAIMKAFEPQRPGDLDIVQEVILDSMRFITGPPFEIMKKVSHRLGIIDRNISFLGSFDRHKRAHAVETLGVMQATQAIIPLLEMLSTETNDIKLVALRSLAIIKDPRALPYFHHTAKNLPPPLLPRLASIMLEFGPAAHPHLHKLVTAHRSVFPQLMLEELLRELATDLKRPDL
ncbi:MAG: HEAT repeat domain-containing protein [Elusimicrobia bacterium]|nr:HEAT repeat domain-containing protein [Elusimicrobiota bacterium]